MSPRAKLLAMIFVFAFVCAPLFSTQNCFLVMLSCNASVSSLCHSVIRSNHFSTFFFSVGVSMGQVACNDLCLCLCLRALVFCSEIAFSPCCFATHQSVRCHALCCFLLSAFCLSHVFPPQVHMVLQHAQESGHVDLLSCQNLPNRQNTETGHQQTRGVGSERSKPTS